jgi:branched-chain amino acid transport system permease protein
MDALKDPIQKFQSWSLVRKVATSAVLLAFGVLVFIAPLAITILGVVTGAIYAVAASGLVLTYTTSGIFNFAHGAIGGLMAFLYWELRFKRGLPAPLAIIAVVGVAAPLLGALIERTLMRNLGGATTRTSLVVTIGLMVMLIGLTQGIWAPTTPRQFPLLFGQAGFKFGGVFVLWHQILTIVVAAAVAGSFWFLLNRTRTGVAMRAVVDDRNLAALNGASPARVSMLSWALGSSTAAMAGILIAPIINLEILNLTLLVVYAYAAAVVGRLRSLPLTFAGAIGLGLALGYLDLDFFNANTIPGLRGSLQTIMLFAVLLFLPEQKLRAGRLTGAKEPRVPNLKESVMGAGLMIIVTAGVSTMLTDEYRIRVGQGLALALIMLSLVVLTGYGGQVSLCQMTFVGLGAFAMFQWGQGGSPLGLVMAALVAAPLGALVAIPALRLTGLYLALATMAFGVLAEEMILPRSWMFGSGSREIPRLSGFAGEQAFFVLLGVAFALMGIFVLWLRRGRFGRLLAAMKDSPTACTTLGLNLTTIKLGVFTLSAAMAGLGGAFYGGLRGATTRIDFIMFQSLPVLLAAVIGGITTISGALIGGVAFALLPIIQDRLPALQGIIFIATGAAAISLGRNPHGVAFFLSQKLDRVLGRGTPPSAQTIERQLSPEEVTAVAAAAR